MKIEKATRISIRQVVEERVNKMPGSCFAISLAMTAALLSSCTSAGHANDKCRWNLVPVYETRVNWLISLDLENDGVDEVLECVGQYAYLKDQKGVIKKQISLDVNQVFPAGASDVNRDGRTEIFLSVTYRDTAMLAVYDDMQPGGKKFFMFAGKNLREAGPVGYDGCVGAMLFDDLNGDGSDDAISLVQTGFDLYPRGITAFDIKNGHELWHFWTSCPPIGPAWTSDVNGDGKREIVCGTLATCNGARVEGMDDSQSQVFVLDHQGKLLWRRVLGERSTLLLVRAGDITRDDRVDIVVCETHGLGQRTEPNQIWILDASTGETVKYLATGEKFLGMEVCDYDRDGRLEILAGNSDGKLRVFDRELDVVAERKFETGVLLSQVEDIDGNGTKEVLLVLGDGRLVILDEKLKIACVHTSPQGRINNCILARDGRRRNIVARVSAGHESINTIYRVSVVPGVTRVPTAVFLTAVIVLLVGGLGYSVYERQRFDRTVRSFVDEVPIAAILVDRSGRVTYNNNKANELIGAGRDLLLKFVRSGKVGECLAAPARFSVCETTHQGKHLEVGLYTVGANRVLVIRDLTAEKTSREVLAWSGLAQRLAHEIKNPLSTINLALQRLQDVCKNRLGDDARAFNNYTGLILQETARMRETTDKFMHVLSLAKPSLALNDINQLIEKTLQRYIGKLPEDIKVEKHFAGLLPPVKCDESQIGMLLANLIDNAVQAMEGKGQLTLRTSLVEKVGDGPGSTGVSRHVEIKVEDAGLGMDEAETAGLFKPFNSRKPGGSGLGLVIVKRIVEEHAGTIAVESKPNVGTVVRIELPAGQVNSG